MEKPEQILEKFSPLSLMEYIRMMTAARLTQHENVDSVKFKISTNDYQQMMSYELLTPLIGLTLNHSAQESLLTVTADNEFISQYNNKIMKEVVTAFAENYKQRYSKWITVEEEI